MVCFLRNKNARKSFSSLEEKYETTLGDGFYEFLDDELGEKYKSKRHEEVAKRFLKDLEEKPDEMRSWIEERYVDYAKKFANRTDESISTEKENKEWKRARRERKRMDPEGKLQEIYA